MSAFADSAVNTADIPSSPSRGSRGEVDPLLSWPNPPLGEATDSTSEYLDAVSRLRRDSGETFAASFLSSLEAISNSIANGVQIPDPQLQSMFEAHPGTENDIRTALAIYSKLDVVQRQRLISAFGRLIPPETTSSAN